MIQRMVFLAALLGVATLTACTSMTSSDAARFDAIVASPVRIDADRRTDAARHPTQFLPFTQVKPGMRALDVSAGGGYTSQLMALAVGPSGVLYAQAPNPGATLTRRLADHPQANFVVVARPFDDPVPPEAHDLDVITLIQNYHDIANLPVDRVRMNRQLFAALKPGGHYIVVDHAARAGTGTADTRTLHRIDEAVVRNEVTQAGFVLEAEGSFLRNPDDPRDKTSGDSPFFTDKFALRFVKPR
ncbi:MAG TPA: SAM-dependent methyltransferase [Casimicrobiaceae bacterium]|nr:SAM-dependent methyltransferase [Casimicrobiaceae bacterium]